MAVVEIEDIKEIIKADSPAFIKEAKQKQVVLNVHVNGRGVTEYLDKIEGHENERQWKLRKKTAISNKFLNANILRPVDKVFNAKGGSNTFLVDGGEENLKRLKKHLNNVRFGKSIRNWIQTVQANKYYSDPAGVVFFENKDKETWPTLKSIQGIKNYETEGRDLDWILFEGEDRKDKNGEPIQGKFFRFVDDEKDIVLHWTSNEDIKEVEDETFENPWKRVPAIVNSDILNDLLKYSDSPLDIIVELEDKYLRSNTVKNIYEFLHGYPFFWKYAQKCESCKGSGEKSGEDCKTCGGSGVELKKDVSDVFFLGIPKTKDAPTITPDVAGYIEPSIETWAEMRTELKFMWKAMHFTLWGTSFTDEGDGGEKETATGRFLDEQPVNERLGGFSDSFESMEQKMTDFIGEFYLGKTYKGSSISYGRRYMLEAPDVIWKKYQDARHSGAPMATLTHLLIQYFQSEFMNDMETLALMMKGMKVEPFVHSTVDELRGVVDDESLQDKTYFNEWWLTMDEQKIITSTIDKLKKMLRKFASQFTLKESAFQRESTVSSQEEEVPAEGD